jgi:hypothetical protein
VSVKSNRRSRSTLMTKTGVSLHCAIAAIAVLGICGQPNLRAQEAAGPVTGVVRVGPSGIVAGEDPDAAKSMYQGILVVGANPPTYGPPPTWPCYGGGGDAPCSSIAAGGFVIPVSMQVIPTKFNGEVVWTFATTTASGTADMKLEVKQGKKTLSSDSFSFDVAPDGIYYAYAGELKLSGAGKGKVTVTATTTVGSETITGRAVLQVQ